MPISLRLPPAPQASLARKTGRSKAAICREIVANGLEDADYYLGEHVLERIRAGKERTFTLEEVRKELSLE